MAMPQRAMRTDETLGHARCPAPPRTGPRARVLVVEDHEDTREALAVLLRTEGYAIVAAPDGARP